MIFRATKKAPWFAGLFLAASFAPGAFAAAAVPAGVSAQAKKGTEAAPKAPPAFPMPVSAPAGKLPAAFLKPAPSSVEDLASIETQVKSVVARVSPAVVSVAIKVGNSAEISGSAVVISEDGLVLTVAHVGEYPGRDVTFFFPDGRRAKGKTLGTNHDADSGLMQITDPGPWPHVSVGELGQAKLGDWVLALGHPGGYDMNRPIVARLGRIIMLAPEQIQTDCTLLGGDSGGPLFDMSGRVIAIHSAISQSPDANYHVPITTFMETWDRLASSENWGVAPGSVASYVGAGYVTDQEGVRLTSITEGGPAEAAKLRIDDVVRKINGKAVKDQDAFRRSISDIRSGTMVTLEILRAGKSLSVPVTIVAPPGSYGRSGGAGRGGRGGP